MMVINIKKDNINNIVKSYTDKPDNYSNPFKHSVIKSESHNSKFSTSTGVRIIELNMEKIIPISLISPIENGTINYEPNEIENLVVKSVRLPITPKSVKIPKSLNSPISPTNIKIITSEDKNSAIYK